MLWLLISVRAQYVGQVESHSTRPLIHNSLQIAETETFMEHHFLGSIRRSFYRILSLKALEIGDKDKRENIEKTVAMIRYPVMLATYISQNHRTFKSDTQSSYVILDFDTFDMDSETIFPLLRSFSRRRAVWAFALLAYLCRNMYHRYLYKIADTETGVFTIGESYENCKLANLLRVRLEIIDLIDFLNVDSLII